MTDLPDSYENEALRQLGYSPRSDWAYWQAAHGPGARYAGHGVQVNAAHAKRRLQLAGLWERCCDQPSAS